MTTCQTTRARGATTLAAALIVVTGCGGDPATTSAPADPASSAPAPSSPSAADSAPGSEPDSGSASGSASGSRSASASARSRGNQPFEADLRPDVGGVLGTGNGLTVTDVRVGRHDGFDRVVVELDGTGRPGWRVEYVASPRADGSGERLDLAGDAFLQVDLRGMGMPFDTGIEELHRDRVPGTGGIAEVAPGGVFEGHQLALVGLVGDRRPFRAFSVSNPARVVVDVVRG